MLEAIRERAQGWIAKVILALITIPFAMWGIDSYFQSGGNEPPVATLGDESVSQREFFRALQNQRDAMQERGNVQVDIENKAFRQGVLDQLVEARLIAVAAARNGLIIPAGQMDAVIKSAQIFQENGAFSEQMFQSWLRQQGLSQQELSQMIMRDALAQQFQVGYGQGAVVAGATAARISGLMAQQREVQEAVFASDAFLKTVAIDDKAVEAEYKANQADYATPAQVRVQYLTLSAEDMRATAGVDEAAAKQHYEANKSRFQQPEERSASHILIKADAGMSAADKAAAKAKAEQLYVQVKAAPARFAELAKQHSQDPGSAARGGDLGSFTRDTMVKPFADAVFAMQTGELRGPVESEFGYHIIRLDRIAPGSTVAFDTVKAEIMDELARQSAERQFAEAAERFSNMVYEQADSLAPAAKEFGLTVRESGWISSTQADPAFLAKPALLAALFAPEALEKHQNTEAIEVEAGKLVAARVLEHKPAGTRPLAEVAANIRAKLALRAAHAKAVEVGQGALKAAQAGQPVAGLGAPMQVSRMRPLNLPPESVKAIFKADAGKLPTAVGTETRDGYRLYRITSVTEGAPDATRVTQIQRDLTRMTAQEELKAYLAYLKTAQGVEINNAVLEKKAD
jgi:peptidyl-prolyl cis-trans isomerase D